MKDIERKIKFYRSISLILFLFFLLEILFLPRILNRLCPKSQDETVQKAIPSATSQIERIFEFPVEKFSKNNFKLSVVRAEKVGFVTTNNQPVSAKQNEEFLLIYLELENNLETPITIDSQNYFRLIGENEKKSAPDFYNGPIQVSPISVKKDQLGFVVEEEQKDFRLQVGEIEGEKEIIEFKF